MDNDASGLNSTNLIIPAAFIHYPLNAAETHSMQIVAIKSKTLIYFDSQARPLANGFLNEKFSAYKYIVYPLGGTGHPNKVSIW